MSNLDLTDPANLAPFRQQADPLADEVIADIMAAGDNKAINILFNQLRNTSDIKNADLPPSVANYFEVTSQLPEWTDPTKIAVGEKLFSQYGPHMSMLLLCKSLPEAYSAAKGAMVMYRTGRMVEHQGSLQMFTRRLMETAQFVINVCAPGGLSDGGTGVITAQKVRLIHASIRYYLHKAGWDTDFYGQPINQEDMAGTLQSFSSLILEGMIQLGVELTPAEIDGYFHCWRVVGHIIGLDPQLNVLTYEEGLKLGYAILNDQKEKSEQGEALTKALVDFMEQIIPGNIFDSMPSAMIRYLVGDETADLLGVEDSESLMAKLTPVLLKVFYHGSSELEEHSKLFRKIAEHLNLALLQGMLNHFNGDKAVQFYIPPDLQHNWKLTNQWEPYKGLTPNIAGYRLAIERNVGKLEN